MSENNLVHIVSFNIPYPADYGGVIDIFYKLKSLHRLGAKIYLHCYTYGRKEAKELEKYCEKVFYYKRKKGVLFLLKKLPYIVASRNSKELLNNLKAKKAPIIFEGLHTCFWINHPDLKKHYKIIRAHNVEHNYYAALAESETNPLKKIYFKLEAKKLRRFEEQAKADCLLTISKADQEYFERKHTNSILISGFHSFKAITSQTGKGNYILFHGNLGVPENKKAIEFILSEVRIQEHLPLVIAGKNPSSELVKLARKFEKLRVIENPGENAMQELIHNAQICFIPTFQSTGLKLKLLGSLFASRFVVTNSAMVKNTGLEELCEVYDEPEELKNCILSTFSKSFSEEDISKRKAVLEQGFSNKINAKKLFTIITNNFNK